MLETASIIHSAKEGVKASHDREDEDIMFMMITVVVSEICCYWKNPQRKKEEKLEEKHDGAIGTTP